MQDVKLSRADRQTDPLAHACRGLMNSMYHKTSDSPVVVVVEGPGEREATTEYVDEREQVTIITVSDALFIHEYERQSSA